MLTALSRARAGSLLCRLTVASLVATGIAALLAGRSVALTTAAASPTRLAVTPAVGGPTSIMSVHFIADYTANVYGGDSLSITGPDNTLCAGELIESGDVNGPNADGSGPVTLYIGPHVEVVYPWMAG